MECTPIGISRTWRGVALLGLMELTSACAPRTARPDPASGPAGLPVKVAYREPENPSHRAVLADVGDRQFLERVAEVLGVVRLPRPLTLSLTGCGGAANAWYDPDEGTVTFCYEYLAEIYQRAAAEGLEGVAARDAGDGAAAFVLLHESGHAVFDLLQVPLLGSEEDAADVFATVILLRLGRDVALRMLRGAVQNYAMEARARRPDEGDFADEHGLDAQRYYNILCLAYGSDPAYFANAVKVGGLPEDRAEGCRQEYHQALFGMQKLIAPSVDARALERLRVKHGPGWDSRRSGPGRPGSTPRAGRRSQVHGCRERANRSRVRRKPSGPGTRVRRTSDGSAQPSSRRWSSPNLLDAREVDGSGSRRAGTGGVES
jgi:hypothetical protein